MRRYPLGPLLAATGLSRSRLGLVVGASGATMARLVVEGLTEWEADRMACRAGFHPGAVWPDEWWAVAA